MGIFKEELREFRKLEKQQVLDKNSLRLEDTPKNRDQVNKIIASLPEVAKFDLLKEEKVIGRTAVSILILDVEDGFELGSTLVINWYAKTPSSNSYFELRSKAFRNSIIH